MTEDVGTGGREGASEAGMPAREGPTLRRWRRLEQLVDRLGGPALNPMRQLGALAFLALWVLGVTGVWLYAVLDTSASGAYASIQGLSASPWSPGGLMRSLHR